MTKEELKEHKKTKPQKQEPHLDRLKMIEMQLNKKEMLLEKAKMVVLKLDKVFLVFPYTTAKIELRLRNILLNHKKLLDGIAHFMNFFLENHRFQEHLMNKYAQHL
jgi:hypothetical protein